MLRTLGLVWSCYRSIWATALFLDISVHEIHNSLGTCCPPYYFLMRPTFKIIEFSDSWIRFVWLVPQVIVIKICMLDFCIPVSVNLLDELEHGRSRCESLLWLSWLTPLKLHQNYHILWATIFKNGNSDSYSSKILSCKWMRFPTAFINPKYMVISVFKPLKFQSARFGSQASL
jgi:hypothetical protein